MPPTHFKEPMPNPRRINVSDRVMVTLLESQALSLRSALSELAKEYRKPVLDADGRKKLLARIERLLEE